MFDGIYSVGLAHQYHYCYPVVPFRPGVRRDHDASCVHVASVASRPRISSHPGQYHNHPHRRGLHHQIVAELQQVGTILPHLIYPIDHGAYFVWVPVVMAARRIHSYYHDHYHYDPGGSHGDHFLVVVVVVATTTTIAVVDPSDWRRVAVVDDLTTTKTYCWHHSSSSRRRMMVHARDTHLPVIAYPVIDPPIVVSVIVPPVTVGAIVVPWRYHSPFHP